MKTENQDHFFYFIRWFIKWINTRRPSFYLRWSNRGRIIDVLMEAGTMDMIIFFDELDKAVERKDKKLLH